jgi:hypothetical protein
MKCFKKYILFLIITTIAACSDDSDDKIVEIVDFTRPSEFEFTSVNAPLRSDTNVTTAMLFVKGELQQGEVRITADGAGSAKVSGKVDTSFSHGSDLYVGRATLYVTPIAM